MKSRWNMIWIVLMTLTLVMPALFARAGKPEADKTEKKEAKDSGREKELQERFKQRYDQIRGLKKQGVIGETTEGYLDFVEKKPTDAEKLINEENDDRRELYKLIAQKEGTTPEKVASLNAKRNFQKAAAGEFLKGADGKWTKKS